MYKLQKILGLYDTPWEKDFEEKINELLQSKKNGFQIVVYCYPKPDASTFRYRGYNMCQALERSTQWRGFCFFNEELDKLRRYLYNVDLVVMIRVPWNKDIDDFIEMVHKINIPVAFDVDDLVYDIRYFEILADTISLDYSIDENCSYWFNYMARLGKSAGLCDAVITTNEHLAQNLRKDLGKEVYVIPNFLNREQMLVSKEYCEQKKGKKTEKFMIGYFSGSPTHYKDLKTIEPVLLHLLRKENIYLKIVGYMSLPESFGYYEKIGKIVQVPFCNFIDLQKEIAEVDVNVVPLINNVFTNCKSELKYFEAAVVNTVTCAVDTYVYQKLVDNKKDGYICSNELDWYSTILDLYQNGVDELVVKNAYKKSEMLYGYFNMSSQIDTVLNLLSKDR